MERIFNKPDAQLSGRAIIRPSAHPGSNFPHRDFRGISGIWNFCPSLDVYDIRIEEIEMNMAWVEKDLASEKTTR